MSIRTKKELKGILAAVTTPFTADGSSMQNASENNTIQLSVF